MQNLLALVPLIFAKLKLYVDFVLLKFIATNSDWSMKLTESFLLVCKHHKSIKQCNISGCSKFQLLKTATTLATEAYELLVTVLCQHPHYNGTKMLTLTLQPLTN